MNKRLVKAWINDNIGYYADRQQFKENYKYLYKDLMELLRVIDNIEWMP